MSAAPAPLPTTAAAGEDALPPARRRLAAGVVAGAAGAVLLLAGQAWLFNALAWVNREPLANPEWGINYSCNYAEYLLLEDPTRGLGPVPDDRPGRVQWCADTFARLLDVTGARHVRLSVEWDQVEPREAAFDFALVDALLATAEAKGAAVLLTIGIKAQRHPEYYIPAWAREGTELPEGATVTEDELLRVRALRMVDTVARHVAPSPAIVAWGADNEPFVPSGRANHWRIGEDFVAEEVRIFREADARGRPVIVNQAQHTLWDRYEQQRDWILAHADGLAISFYPRRNHTILGWDLVVPIPELAPVHPNYAAHAREAREAGRTYWITELQAEPWADRDMHLISPQSPSPNLGPGDFDGVVTYARRTGATRVYLWGAEWWLYQQERYGDARWVEMGRELLAGE
ncbi:MAG: beta-galactosidase [Dehalococcoidia bacterium]|nr:beta-galactosidase [Dehalococcoidia bacterium]